MPDADSIDVSLAPLIRAGARSPDRLAEVLALAPDRVVPLPGHLRFALRYDERALHLAVWPDKQARLHVGTEVGVEWPALFSTLLEAESVEQAASALILREIEPGYASHNQVTEVIEELRLDLAPHGFVGSGVATIRRSCPGGADRRYTVDVAVGPDTTSPNFFPRSRFKPYFVSWGDFQIDATEPLDLSEYQEDFHGALRGGERQLASRFPRGRSHNFHGRRYPVHKP